MLTPRARAQSGASMIEVLIAIVIVVLGLLGLASLQTLATMAESEAFQRSQALVLLQDMVDRLNANRRNSMDYVTASPLGTGAGAVRNCAGLAGKDRDLCDWHNALLGAGEEAGGLKVGAMIGARGCVTNLKATMPREFEVAVVWQGLNSTKAPGTACGSGQFGTEAKRRAVVANVVIGCLQNDPATGTCVTP